MIDPKKKYLKEIITKATLFEKQKKIGYKMLLSISLPSLPRLLNIFVFQASNISISLFYHLLTTTRQSKMHFVSTIIATALAVATLGMAQAPPCYIQYD